MSDTQRLRDVADHHAEEANRRRQKVRRCYTEAEKADAADHGRAAKVWRTQGVAEQGVAASQSGESERLRMMADVYDEIPE